jgi:hypothetical protein
MAARRVARRAIRGWCTWMIDLVLLAADKNIEAGVGAILKRHHSLGCHQINWTPFVHPHRDPGCYGRAAEFLQGFTSQFEHALVVFDLEGSGSTFDRTATEAQVESRLQTAGWNGDRAACVVVDPEIENWVWSDSPRIPEVLGWKEDTDMRSALDGAGYWPTADLKPPRPKETLEFVLRSLRRPRSSAIYASLGSAVGLARCSDAAFAKLRAVALRWFPATESVGKPLM